MATEHDPVRIDDRVHVIGAHPLAAGLLRGVDTGRILKLLEYAGGKAMGTTCAAHTHDSWVPIEIHHVWPLGDGGPNIATNRLPLCSNAHGSVHYCLDMMRKGYVPWKVRRHYGPGVRAVAERGWAEITAHRDS